MPVTEVSSAEVLLEKLLEDDDFEQLEEITQPFNVFEVLNAVSQEIRHSNFLAWLLNPSANHGLGEYFLEQFLWRTSALAREQSIDTIRPLYVDSLDLSGVVAMREWRNIDITLKHESQQFVCAIENKVSSSEHGNQLARYAAALEKEHPNWSSHLIYLTPDRLQPSDGRWVAVGYDAVLEMVEGALKSKSQALGDEVRVFLSHYADMLRRYVMSESEVENLCRRIYARHRSALDLIFEFRVDRQSEVRRVLEDIINGDPELMLDGCSKAYVRFAAAAWDSLHLPRGSGWTKSGKMLLFQFNNDAVSLRLTLALGPGDQADRERLFTAIRDAPFFSGERSLYKQWNTVWRMDFLRRDDYEREMEWIETRIREQMETFKSTHFAPISALVTSIAN